MVTLAVYVVVAALIYTGAVWNTEHEEVGANASLICYACIGVN
jgi:hypothetical protein